MPSNFKLPPGCSLVEETVIRIGYRSDGYFASRPDPRFWREGRECPAIYLHPDGLWRSACLTHDGRSGYFDDVDHLKEVLLRSLVVLREQTGRPTRIECV